MNVRATTANSLSYGLVPYLRRVFFRDADVMNIRTDRSRRSVVLLLRLAKFTLCCIHAGSSCKRHGTGAPARLHLQTGVGGAAAPVVHRPLFAARDVLQR